MVDCNLEKSTDLKILNFNSNYISMLIVTEKSYVYAEKYYKNRDLQSCLTIEIFKEQRRTEVNYDRVKYLIFSNIVKNQGFDEKEFLKSELSSIGKKEFGVEIQVYSESDNDIYDPKGKARHARPFKPAILIE